MFMIVLAKYLIKLPLFTHFQWAVGTVIKKPIFIVKSPK